MKQDSKSGLTARGIVLVRGKSRCFLPGYRRLAGRDSPTKRTKPEATKEPFWRCDRAREQSTATIAHLSARALRIQPACPAWGFAGSAAVRPELRSSDGVHAVLGGKISEYLNGRLDSNFFWTENKSDYHLRLYPIESLTFPKDV
jgi:hypothetical protein